MEIVMMASVALLITLYGVTHVSSKYFEENDIIAANSTRLLWLVIDSSYITLSGILTYVMWNSLIIQNQNTAIMLGTIVMANIILQLQCGICVNRQFDEIWKYIDGMSIATLLIVILGNIGLNHIPNTGTCTSTQGPERSHHY